MGVTAWGNPITVEVLSGAGPGPGGDPFVLLVGGVHPQEHTGWRTESGTADGWLALAKQWFWDHPFAWPGLRMALIDMNPDGAGRWNPAGVDLQRNFGGEECPICAWRETDPQTRTRCDADGPAPLSEPESRALLNAVEELGRRGDVALVVFLHSQAPPNGLVDAAFCGQGGNALSCTLGQELARRAGADYITRWESYGCEGDIPEGLAGQPPDYLSFALNIPAADYEFPQREPSSDLLEQFASALVGAVYASYGLTP